MTATKEQQNQRQNQPQQDEVGSCLSSPLYLGFVSSHPPLARALTLPRLDAAFQ